MSTLYDGTVAYTIALPYFGGRYYFTFPQDGFLYALNYKLWGAGGGAGGADSRPGGNGAGGGFVEGTAWSNAFAGSTVEVFVGGGGSPGVSGGNATGGSNGRSATGFSGGPGGNSGPGGWSGSGGGGGGATVLRISGLNIAIAGAGGGGGGGGNHSDGVSAGAAFNHTYKQDLLATDQGKGWHGLSHYGDGGGGGGGGGGDAGGGPGAAGSGDNGGQGGASGTNGNQGDFPLTSGIYGIGIIPGGINVAGYPGNRVGMGGSYGAGQYYPGAGTNGAWSSLLNNYGVWSGNGIYTWQVYFPNSGTYNFEGSVDNYGSLLIDDVEVLSIPTYSGVYTSSGYVSAGWHTVKMNATNTGGPAGTSARILYNGSAIWTTRSIIDPNLGGASPAGGNGYAILTLYRVSDFFVKVDGSFRRAWPRFKNSSSYNVVPSSYIKVNGVWRSVINDLTVNVSQDYTNWGDNGVPEAVYAPEPTFTGYWDGGSGGDSSTASTSCDSSTSCSADGGGGGGGGCFLAGTLVRMADGTEKPIETIQSGDVILEALTGQPAKVIGVKTRAHDVNKWVFALDKKVHPYITEEHPFYNENNELCAISELASELAPWLGPIKIVEVQNKTKIKEAVTVYNLMLETGESHWANGVRVSNIVKTGGAYALVYKGFLDKSVYENHVYNTENKSVSPEQQTLIFNYTLKLTNYILHNDNVRSRALGHVLAWAIKNREAIYPYLDRWFKSRVRRWLLGKNI